MNPLIERNLTAIVALGLEFGVTRLELFGSAATDAFDPERSDVDFIVAYPPEYDFGPWLTRFQELEESLQAVLGRNVNLVMTSALENRWFGSGSGEDPHGDLRCIPNLRSCLMTSCDHAGSSLRTPGMCRSKRTSPIAR